MNNIIISSSDRNGCRRNQPDTPHKNNIPINAPITMTHRDDTMEGAINTTLAWSVGVPSSVVQYNNESKKMACRQVEKWLYQSIQLLINNGNRKGARIMWGQLHDIINKIGQLVQSDDLKGYQIEVAIRMHRYEYASQILLAMYTINEDRAKNTLAYIEEKMGETGCLRLANGVAKLNGGQLLNNALMSDRINLRLLVYDNIGYANIFDDADWMHIYGVDIVGGVPDLPDNIIDILNSDDPISGHVVKEMYYLQLVPKYVRKNGVPIELTFEHYGADNGLMCDVMVCDRPLGKIQDYDVDGRFNGIYRGYESFWSQVSVYYTAWYLFYLGDRHRDNGLLTESRSKPWRGQLNHVDGLNQRTKKAVANGRIAVSHKEVHHTIFHIAAPLDVLMMVGNYYNKTGDTILSVGDGGKVDSYARTTKTWNGWRSDTRVGIGGLDPEGLHVDSEVFESGFDDSGVVVFRVLN